LNRCASDVESTGVRLMYTGEMYVYCFTFKIFIARRSLSLYEFNSIRADESVITNNILRHDVVLCSCCNSSDLEWPQGHSGRSPIAFSDAIFRRPYTCAAVDKISTDIAHRMVLVLYRSPSCKLCYTTRLYEKRCHYAFVSNFARCWLITKILSVTDLAVNYKVPIISKHDVTLHGEM